MIIHLDNSADPRVSDYVSLTDVQLRKAKEPAEGLYIAESPKVVRRSLAAGHQPRSFFVSEKRLPEVQDVLDAHPDIPAYVGTAAMLEEITGINLHRGAMAAMNRPPRRTSPPCWPMPGVWLSWKISATIQTLAQSSAPPPHSALTPC